MKRNIIAASGVIMIAVGVGFILGGQSITGFAVVQTFNKSAISLLGIIVVLIGVTMTLNASHTTREETKSELELHVKDFSNGKANDETKDKYYALVGKTKDLGAEGKVTLGEVKKQVNILRSEHEGEMLVEIIREEYGPPLQRIARSENKNDAKIAREFLNALGLEAKIETQRYQMPTEERQEIQNAFRGYNGTLSTEQKKIFSKYGLTYETSRGNHVKITGESGKSFFTSSTPSDNRVGKNIATKIIHYIENERNN